MDRSNMIRYGVIFLVFVILIILLVVGTGAVKRHVKKQTTDSPMIITSPVNSFESKKYNGDNFQASQNGMQMSWSTWIFINRWDYKFGSWKNIFVRRDSNSTRRSPGLWLYPKTNALHARISTSFEDNEGCDVQNIPLQQWVMITYVLNNRTVDIYINGKLERSCVLKGVPNIDNNDDLFVCEDGGFYGQISKLQYFNRSLVPSEVLDMYKEGPYINDAFRLPVFKTAPLKPMSG